MLLDIKSCPKCRVPELFSQELSWLDNGDIVQRTNQNARAAFIECENLDPLIKNIGDIIGMPIERLIINITARGARRYNETILPDLVRQMIRKKQIELSPIAEAVGIRGQIMGYGKHEWVDYRYENDQDDFSIQKVGQPFSVPMMAGNYAGALSAAVGGEHAVSYEQVQQGVYEFKTHWTEYTKELKKRLVIFPYQHHEGKFDLERCSSCGGPKSLSDYSWYYEEGLIKHKQTGRRMALLGPQLVDPVFSALEDELGESIPQIVVEGQRRFVQTGFPFLDLNRAKEDLRLELALRGLGNLQELDVSSNSLRVRLSNACLHLLLLGFMQGTFELTFDVASDIDWNLSEEGDLEFEVTPKQ